MKALRRIENLKPGKYVCSRNILCDVRHLLFFVRTEVRETNIATLDVISANEFILYNSFGNFIAHVKHKNEQITDISAMFTDDARLEVSETLFKCDNFSKLAPPIYNK